ncbi:CDGSH iron-sulfur domain-containing protein [Streptomyces sp. NPDC012510]|uniref:CDGSH iron-sulfur domain-containing protein n=1 Tax=Streptomyces sp. NPDC012510 TaxID=3364838 RepID=UPI0036E3945C
MPNAPADRRRIRVQRPGPMLVEGPVEVTLEDGTTVSSDRFCVALCTCRRSRIYPWCDTSHRRRAAADSRPHADPGSDSSSDSRPRTDVDGARRRAQPPD